MNAHRRIIVCGIIADYDTDKPSPGPNWLIMVRKRLSITGFTMPDHWADVPDMMQKLDGLESSIESINLLFTGGNQGKLMVEL